MGVSAALLARDDGSDGVSSAAAPAPATPAATTPPAFDGDDAGAGPPPCAGATDAGVTVCACPLGLVMVTTFVVLLTTTVLWMLL